MILLLRPAPHLLLIPLNRQLPLHRQDKPRENQINDRNPGRQAELLFKTGRFARRLSNRQTNQYQWFLRDISGKTYQDGNVLLPTTTSAAQQPR
jgi:hypothetical protein